MLTDYITLAFLLSLFDVDRTLAFYSPFAYSLDDKFLKEKENHDNGDNRHKHRGENQLPGIAKLARKYPGKVQFQYEGFTGRVGKHEERQKVIVPYPHGIEDYHRYGDRL
jgi:hypothetical protein